MANMLKLGSITVNLDRVTCIRDLSVRNEAGQVTRPFYRVEFGNRDHVEISSEAPDLQRWLSAIPDPTTPLS